MARNRSHSGVMGSISAARLLAALIVTILVGGMRIAWVGVIADVGGVGGGHGCSERRRTKRSGLQQRSVFRGRGVAVGLRQRGIRVGQRRREHGCRWPDVWHRAGRADRRVRNGLPDGARTRG